MSPGRKEDGGRIAIVNLNPGGAIVDPALFRVPSDDHAAGADVASSIILVPARAGKDREIHIIALERILQDGTPGYLGWGKRG
jgi:hypothetical protein